jgi:hypothetical protein
VFQILIQVPALARMPAFWRCGVSPQRILTAPRDITDPAGDRPIGIEPY